MKQIIQDIKTGKTILEDLPGPIIKQGHILIKTTKSLVSLGTEKMLVEFGKASLIQKAKQQPDKVKEVLDKIKAEGLLPTLDAVFNKLNQPLPLGYCNVGRVIEIGEGVSGIHIGDRVVSNGNHAEFVCVPKNLAAKIPDNVSDIDAAFTVVGSIGLQGIRLLNPTFGESVVVIGLGLIGLLTAEILKSNGCNVIGYDFDESKVSLAIKKGIKAFNPLDGNDPVKYIKQLTNGKGADGVIITASNKSDDIIHQAADMSRKRGRIILVGVIGLNIRRSDFYEKELTFQVSCSYGPGRYDDDYEFKGIDYPMPYVRWTEKRNFESILNALSQKTVKVSDLVTECVPLNEYHRVYDNLGTKGSIASILEYDETAEYSTRYSIQEESEFLTNGKGIGIIGAGNFTNATVLPNLKSLGANIQYISSAGGLSARILAKKFKISHSTTDYNDLLQDDALGLVLITTRHNLHASMIVNALNKGKHIFVEKPLCLNENELSQIIELKKKCPELAVNVGFNRRFSPFSQKAKKLLGTAPMHIVATMNAGFIPENVWVHDLKTGGGRIIGEACHFMDLCSFFTESKIVSVCMNALGENPDQKTDNASILLKYENGSNAVINYFANGSKAYGKERIEIFSQQRTLVIDNWRKMYGYGIKGFSKQKTKMNKGHYNQFKLLLENFNGGKGPIIPFDEIVNTTNASFAAIRSLKEHKWIDIVD